MSEFFMPIDSEIQDLINKYFPPEGHPYRKLEETINNYLTPSSTVLDIGCGYAAPVLQSLKGKAATLIGIDIIDAIAVDKDLILFQNDLTNMVDVATASVDVAYSRSVMEHVRDVELAFTEIHRVLKPGGYYIFLTPNFYDYASLIAAVVPNSWHPWIVNRTEGRDTKDTFPTHYRCNTQRKIKAICRNNKFKIQEIKYLSQYPNYFIFNKVLFRLGCMYARFLQDNSLLQSLQGWILCTLRKGR